jgi:hypothetical protein
MVVSEIATRYDNRTVAVYHRAEITQVLFVGRLAF